MTGIIGAGAIGVGEAIGAGAIGAAAIGAGAIRVGEAIGAGAIRAAAMGARRAIGTVGAGRVDFCRLSFANPARSVAIVCL